MIDGARIGRIRIVRSACRFPVHVVRSRLAVSDFEVARGFGFGVEPEHSGLRVCNKPRTRVQEYQIVNIVGRLDVIRVVCQPLR